MPPAPTSTPGVRDRRTRRTRVLAAAVPVAIALAVFCARTRDFPLLGDEPHYLIIADSVISDGDLNLQNNYLRDFDTHRIFGLVTPHVYNVPRGWMPYHAPGLGILLAIPFRIGGVVGARAALILFAAVLPWTLATWLVDRVSRGLAAWITIGLTVSLPLLFDSAQIYPDLPAGIIVTALALWLLCRSEDREAGKTWGVFWAIAGALPWLNVKYFAVTMVLAGGGAALAVRLGPRRRFVPLATSVFLLLGLGGLAAFHVWAFGTPFGARALGELTTSVSRATMLFLGLHLDQSQGLFVQQPLLLAGVAALPLFVRQRPRFALFWAALYASTIVPDALELARYGGGGPVGRFGWTAAWLWSIPIGVAVAAHGRALSRTVRAVVILSLCYQAALATRWLSMPMVLFPEYDGPRDSLFPDVLRRWLPSFYFWDFSSYWRFPPNIAAMLIVLCALLAGMVVVHRNDVGAARAADSLDQYRRSRPV
jgi:hypothetical protein